MDEEFENSFSFLNRVRNSENSRKARSRGSARIRESLLSGTSPTKISCCSDSNSSVNMVEGNSASLMEGISHISGNTASIGSTIPQTAQSGLSSTELNDFMNTSRTQINQLFIMQQELLSQMNVMHAQVKNASDLMQSSILSQSAPTAQQPASSFNPSTPPAPYRLPSNFTPRTIPKIMDLSETNFLVWKQKLRAALINNGVFGVVDGSLDPQYHADLEANAYAILINNISNAMIPRFARMNSSKEIWEYVSYTHHSLNISRKFNMISEFSSFTMLKEENAVAYITRLQTLVTELEIVNETKSFASILATALNGLRPEYASIKPALFAAPEMKSLDDLATSLSLLESCTLKTHSKHNSVALLASNSKQVSGKKAERKEPVCFSCGEKGHIKPQCPKRKAGSFPSKGKEMRSTQHNLMASFAFSPSSCAWLVDSGASIHMCGNLDLFESLTDIEEKQIKFGNGDTVSSCQSGSVILSPDCYPSLHCTLRLSEVLYVPELTANLLSVNQFDSKGVSTFIANGITTFIRNSVELGYAVRMNDLSVLLPKSIDSHAFSALITQSAELWHRRLGHLGYKNLEILTSISKGMDVSAKSIKESSSHSCTSCLKAKAVTPSLPRSIKRPSLPLELLHIDTCGPLPVEGIYKEKYFVVVVDDFSGFTFTQAFELKSQIPTYLACTLFNRIESIAQTKIKAIRTDHGREFENSTLTACLDSRRIQRQYSAPYVHPQNGTAERTIRTVMERIRALLFDSKLPQRFWPEALKTAVFLKNRSPSHHRGPETVGVKTPFELLQGKPPDLSFLRVFGSKAYAKIPKEWGGSKLDPRAAPGVFLGYEEGSKAYRILHLDGRAKGKIVATPHVKFFEDEQFASVSEIYVDPSEILSQDVIVNSEEIVPEDSENQDAEFALAAAALEAESDPISYKQAMDAIDSDSWQLAMNEEIKSLHENQTWELVDLPSDQKPIPVKWVYKKKLKSDGSLERYKARLVVKGFRQKEGIDYKEVYAPVSKHATLRTLLSVVAAEDLELHQLDVKTAFLNGELEEMIFINQPEGFIQDNSKVYRLKKALYGLKQAPRAWNARLKIELDKLGFTQSLADPGLFILRKNEDPVYLLVYVDDLLLASASLALINSVKSNLSRAFEIHDLCDAQFFLGMQILRNRSEKTLKLFQSKYALEVVTRFGLADSNPRSLPISPSNPLSSSTDSSAVNGTLFMEIIGSLMYLAVCTRPDLSYVVGLLSRFASKPSLEHINIAKGVLRYVLGTFELGLVFTSAKPGLQCFCDANYAADVDCRRSTSGLILLLNGGPVSWASKLQPTVAASTTEAEYISAAFATKEILWLKSLLFDFDMPLSSIPVYCDNQAAIKIIRNPISSNRSKHIDVAFHFIRHHVAQGELTFEFCPTARMLADFLTKPLSKERLHACLAGSNIV